jgi:acyl-CoA synthetase (AMP-forming)/AMP-acid ligase II
VVANQPTGLSGDWPQRFRDTLRTRLSSYKIPHHFRRVDELPLTDSGKLKRRTLKEWALAEASAAPAEPAPGGEKH